MLDGLAAFNIFIGPNNSGKSAVFRFLQTVVGQLTSEHFTLRKFDHDIPLDVNWWWLQQAKHPIDAEMHIRFDQPTGIEDAPSVLNNDELRVAISITPRSPRATLLITPKIYMNDEWMPLIRLHEGQFEHLNRGGEYISSVAEDACPFHVPAEHLLKAWARRARFFDPVRALDRPAGRRRMHDGSALLKELVAWQLDPKLAASFESYRRKLVASLNELLFRPSGMTEASNLDIKGDVASGALDMFISFHEDETSIALEHMGTGIAELIILLASILREDTGALTYYFLEEPELHLHPGLVRRTMAKFRRLKHVQFFITSHASVVIDSIESGDTTFHFTHKKRLGATATKCTDLMAMHTLLDDLGISGSSLFQANCVLWAEGPSDKIYLSHWLKHAAADLIEGSDYIFAFYGGKVLSHFGFSCGTDSMISLIRISRYSAVLMDRDTDPATDADVNETKQRIIDEASKDEAHRLAVLTTSREIENDVDPESMRSALSTITRRDLSTLALTGTRPYEEDVATHLGLTEEAAKKIKKKCLGKVALAKEAVCGASYVTTIPPYVDRLIGLIRRSGQD